MGYIRNSVLIEAPVDDVFRLTNDVRTWPELFTEYLSSEVIEEVPGDVTFRLTTHPDENGQTAARPTLSVNQPTPCANPPLAPSRKWRSAGGTIAWVQQPLL